MTKLNSIQQHLYSRARQLTRFLRKSKRIYATVTPFNNEVTAFLTRFDEVSANAAIKAKRGNSITAQKNAVKKEIAQDAAIICSLATAYALAKKDRTFLYQVNHSYTDFYTTRDNTLPLCINTIITYITPYLGKEEFKEYGITAGSLAVLNTRAEQFGKTTSRGKWVNWESDYASRKITATLKNMKDNIAQMERLLLLFKEKHPGFVQGFQQAAASKQTHKARNIIEGIIIDRSTSLPLQQATITIKSNNKTTSTNLSGFYHFTGVKAGTASLTITAQGYLPQTIITKAVRGKTVTVNIHLQATALTLPASEVA